jgi:hypothetical protein
MLLYLLLGSTRTRAQTHPQAIKTIRVPVSRLQWKLIIIAYAFRAHVAVMVVAQLVKHCQGVKFAVILTDAARAEFQQAGWYLSSTPSPFSFVRRNDHHKMINIPGPHQY